MGINIRKRVLIHEEVVHKCKYCNVIFGKDAFFCSQCGKPLVEEKTKVYANYGKNGLTSLSYVSPDGTTFNTKGKLTYKIAEGVSYTTHMNDS